MKLDEEQINFAVEKFFEYDSLISVEKQGNHYIVVTKMLPISN